MLPRHYVSRISYHPLVHFLKYIKIYKYTPLSKRYKYLKIQYCFYLNHSFLVFFAMKWNLQLCVWSIDGWEKKKSRYIKHPSNGSGALVGDTMVQFHYDGTHLLVVHESQLAIYDWQLECLCSVSHSQHFHNNIFASLSNHMQSCLLSRSTNILHDLHHACRMLQIVSMHYNKHITHWYLTFHNLTMQWFPRDAPPSPISSAIYSLGCLLVYAGFRDGAIGIFDAKSLTLKCRIAPSAYIPSSISRYVEFQAVPIFFFCEW